MNKIRVAPDLEDRKAWFKKHAVAYYRAKKETVVQRVRDDWKRDIK